MTKPNPNPNPNKIHGFDAHEFLSLADQGSEEEKTLLSADSKKHTFLSRYLHKFKEVPLVYRFLAATLILASSATALSVLFAPAGSALSSFFATPIPVIKLLFGVTINTATALMITAAALAAVTAIGHLIHILMMDGPIFPATRDDFDTNLGQVSETFANEHLRSPSSSVPSAQVVSPNQTVHRGPPQHPKPLLTPEDLAERERIARAAQGNPPPVTPTSGIPPAPPPLIHPRAPGQ